MPAVHQVLAAEGLSTRMCMALARFYAESRLGWSGPGTRLTNPLARQAFEFARLAEPSE
jgi:hypothetical protein